MERSPHFKPDLAMPPGMALVPFLATDPPMLAVY
jgi:hypothetical protein